MRPRNTPAAGMDRGAIGKSNTRKRRSTRARPIDIKVTLDLPDGVEFLGTERVGDGHGIEVAFPLPDVCQCDARGRKERATYEYKNTVYMARSLDRCGQPCFHRCSRRGHRQKHLPPFKRKHVTYTYHVEEYVVRMLIGSTEEDVAWRLGISAETVERIMENRLRDDQDIAPERTIKPIGLDEISLKKRHKLYVTVMTDLTDPNAPEVLAVARGKDTAAARHCLRKLSPEPREAVQTHRVDMGKVYGPVCNAQLPNSQLIVDRFHVAKHFGEVVDDLRKKATRKHTAKLSKRKRKRFRAQMWEFRRDPDALKPGERNALEQLFAKIPILKELYEVRLEFNRIFDTAPDPATAERQLAALRERTRALGLDFGKFWTTYDNWKTGILNDFDGRYTSTAVEDINNKGRVITKCCYGVKSAGTFFKRIALDVNRASEAVGRGIAEMRESIAGLKAVFLQYCI